MRQLILPFYGFPILSIYRSDSRDNLVWASSYILTPEDYYRNFKQASKAKETFNSYDQKLKTFMKYKGVSPTDFASLIQDKDTRQIEADIIDFIISLKEKHYSIRSQDQRAICI
jgi:hypothetical protein